MRCGSSNLPSSSRKSGRPIGAAAFSPVSVFELSTSTCFFSRSSAREKKRKRKLPSSSASVAPTIGRRSFTAECSAEGKACAESQEKCKRTILPFFCLSKRKEAKKTTRRRGRFRFLPLLRTSLFETTKEGLRAPFWISPGPAAEFQTIPLIVFCHIISCLYEK